MKVKVILNPYANRWQAGNRQEEVEAAFRAAQLDCDIHVTARPGEGTAVAREAASASMFAAVVAAGGDGTINEVINGLLQAAGDAKTIPFGVLPLGTANDLSDTLPLPNNLTEAAQVIADGVTRQIDAGRVNQHFFINNCAIGMEPLVTLENVRMKRLSGNLRYFVSLVRALVRLRAWDMDIDWDDESYSGPVYLLSVCNGPRTGGLFQMAPEADFSDGYFDYVFGPEVSKLTVLAILPKLLNGTHIHHPQITYGRSRKITIKSHPGTPIHADGELFAESLTEINYEILPGKVTVLSPPARG